MLNSDNSDERNSMIKRLLLFFVPAVVFAATTQTQSVTATINAGKTGAPISPYVYGQFIEHIGNIINHGLWAEMLDDRKFYAPVVAAAPEPVAEPARSGREPSRRWTAVGPIESVVMDSTRPYVGEHSPLVKLDGTERRVDSRLNVTGGWSRQGFVASRSRLPRTVKNFFSLTSMFFFSAKGSRPACSARSLAFVASGMSGLASRR